MLKAKEIFDTMIENYSASEKCPVAVDSVGFKDSESYHIQFVDGMIVLKADNPFGAILGWNRARQAAETGFIREHLGSHHPRFPIRMFQGTPAEIDEAVRHGYNAALCTQGEDITPFRNMGLKVFLTVKNPDEEFIDVDGIFVESELIEDDEIKTSVEILEEDLAKWEARTQGKHMLIYQLVHGTGERWTRCFWELCLKAQRGTTLAFPASCPESFWVRLRQSLDIVPTPMLVAMDRDIDLSDHLVDHAFCGGLSKNSNPCFFLI